MHGYKTLISHVLNYLNLPTIYKYKFKVNIMSTYKLLYFAVTHQLAKNYMAKLKLKVDIETNMTHIYFNNLICEF